MMTYPILIDLRGRRVVVVGGGKVAARKVMDLLDAGAQVTVISPTLHDELVALGDQIDVRLSAYTPGMIAEAHPLLVFAATDVSEVNQQVAAEARDLGILVNVTDDREAGNFMSMAAIHRGEITIGVATGGASPALAVHLREQIEAVVGGEYARLARWLGELRPLVRAQVGSEARRRDLWHAILNSPVLEHLRSGDERGARAIIDTLVADAIVESE
jgi:siroheme synthase-like protein